MDGTLIDTDFANFLSYQKAIFSVTKSNINLKYNPNKRFNRRILKIAMPNLTEKEFEKIIKEKEKQYFSFIYQTKLIKKTMKLLLKYSITNKTVLVTNSRKDRAMATLKYFGLEGYFSNIICRDFSDNDEEINKFQNALSKLGIPPFLVIAFENEDVEIENAIKAGIQKIIKI